MIRRLAILSLAVGLILTAGARRAPAYWYDGPSWPSNPVMSLQFGSISNGVTLTDGSTTWGQPAEAAMAIWNQYMDRVQFRVIRDSTASTGLGNGVNNAFWSSSIYGRSWESYAGYALWLSSGSSITEADVLMNNQLSWNSYRGNARSGVVDFRRLVMHGETRDAIAIVQDFCRDKRSHARFALSPDDAGATGFEGRIEEELR